MFPLYRLLLLLFWYLTFLFCPYNIYIYNDDAYILFAEIQLIMFHHSCYYRLEETKSCIKVYYSLRIGTPEYFTARDVSSPHLQVSVKAL